MTEKSMNFSLPNDCEIVANPDSRAMIRINYEKKIWKNFAKIFQTNPKFFSTVTRAYLIEEAFWMASTNRLDCEIFYELISYFRYETEATNWNSLIKILENSRIFPRPCNFSFAELNSALLPPIFDQIGWNETPPFETNLPDFLVEIITKISCQGEVGNCLEIASNEGMKWLNCMKTNDNNFAQCSKIIALVHRPAVYCALAKNNSDAFDYLQTRFCKISHPTVDSADLAFGLRCAGWTGCPTGFQTNGREQIFNEDGLNVRRDFKQNDGGQIFNEDGLDIRRDFKRNDGGQIFNEDGLDIRRDFKRNDGGQIFNEDGLDIRRDFKRNDGGQIFNEGGLGAGRDFKLTDGEKIFAKQNEIL